MKRSCIIFFLFLLQNVFAQEVPDDNLEQQLESLTEKSEQESEDDSYLQQLQEFRRRPINLNEADENELNQLKILTTIQINNLLRYRSLLGKLIDVYEL